MGAALSTGDQGIEPEESGPPTVAIDDAADTWEHYFSSPKLRHVLQRPRLLQQVLCHTRRSTQILGIIGFGRTTLLKQVAERIDTEGGSRGLILDPRGIGTLAHLFSALDFVLAPSSGARRTEGAKQQELEIIAAEIERRAAASSSGRYELLIDDADWLMDNGVLQELFDLLLVAPSLRLTTVSLEGFPRSPEHEAELGRPQRIFMGDLCFTLEESRALIAASLRISPQESLLTERRQESLHRSAAGVPLAIALALDKITGGGSDSYGEASTAIALSAIRVEMERSFPRPPLEYRLMRLIWKLSLMPRFSLRHVSMLDPALTNDELPQVTTMTSLDPGKAVLPGEFVWGDFAWPALVEWNVFTPEARLRLAERLEAGGDRAGAFEQLLFAGDLRQTERMLRRNFLTVYETLSPEGMQHLRERQAEELRSYPYLRAAAMLGNPYAQETELLLCAQNFALLAKRQRTPLGKITALAVRTIILAAVGKHRSQVRRLAHELHAEINAYEAGEADEAVILAETRLMGLLALAAADGCPELSMFLAHPLGESHLDRRNAVMQLLIDTWRYGEQDKERPTIRYERGGYRSLVYSDKDAYEEMDAWQRIDDHAVMPIVGAKQMSPVELARIFRSTWVVENLPRSLHGVAESLAFLLVGNLGDGERRSAELSSPLSEIARSFIALARADPQRCLTLLENADRDWGDRISAIVSSMRAVALLQLGKQDAALHALSRVRSSTPAALAFAASVLPPAELVTLASLVPWFAPYAEEAREHGIFGSGITIPEPQNVQPLTKREREILAGLAQGYTTKRLAEDAFLSVNTVKTHILALSRKLAASGRAEIVRKATELGLFD